MASPSVTSSQRSYDSFEEPVTDVRLLEVRPATKIDDAIVCRSFVTKLTPQLQYYAVSCTWGSCSDQESMTINHRCVAVPANLAEAIRHARAVLQPTPAPDDPKPPQRLLRSLRRLRLRNSGPESPRPGTFWLWIDALCSSTQQRASGLSFVGLGSAGAREKKEPFLHQIYGMAKMVMGWVGPADDGTECLLDALRTIDNALPATFGHPGDRLRNPQNYAPHFVWMNEPALAAAHADMRNWTSIARFFSRDLFHRPWLLSELGLARRPAFLIGTAVIEWMFVAKILIVGESLKDGGSYWFPGELADVMVLPPLEALQDLMDKLQKRCLAEMDDAGSSRWSASSASAVSGES